MKNELEALKLELLKRIEEEEKLESKVTSVPAKKQHWKAKMAYGWCYNEVVAILMTNDK